VLGIPVVQITRPAPRRPLRSELRQQARDLRTIDTISPLVRTGPSGEFNVGAGYCLLYDLRDLANAVVFGCNADVEYLVMDGLDWSLEGRGECSAYVLDMDDRAPRHTIALEQHLTAGEGVRR